MKDRRHLDVRQQKPPKLIENRLPSGDDLRDDGEAEASRSLGKDRAVSALLNLPRVWSNPVGFQLKS